MGQTSLTEPARATITSVRFRNYKALSDFSVELGPFTVLVGPNNAGKSTILSAFRLLSAGLRRARSRNPTLLTGHDRGRKLGYVVGTVGSGVSLENVHTDLADEDTSVSFRLSNGNALRLYFPTDGGCLMFCEGPGRPPANTKEFSLGYPISVTHVPVLGPVEYQEALLQAETVQAALETPRASRHFRNFWYHQQDGFESFSTLLSQTWPAMEIERPEVQFGDETTLAMFCRENRMTREIYWAGSGFQVWCQLLTHVLRGADASLLIVDEPEIYLHPDLQRQLIHVLRVAGADVVLATHSTEILNEVDPSDLVLVDKKEKRGVRLTGEGDVQSAMVALGSNHNVQLTRLARHRRVVFVEGGDFWLIRQFARKLGLREVANGNELVVVKLEGFAGWERIGPVVWGLKRLLGVPLALGVILDRDFRSEEELAAVREHLTEHVRFVHIHERKEIENYLLDPPVLERAILRSAADRARRTLGVPVKHVDVSGLLDSFSEASREEWRGQYQARRAQYLRSNPADMATLNTETSRWFERAWTTITERVKIIHGKKVFAALNTHLQGTLGLTLTGGRVIDAMHRSEIQSDIRELMQKLESFRQSGH